MFAKLFGWGVLESKEESASNEATVCVLRNGLYPEWLCLLN